MTTNKNNNVIDMWKSVVPVITMKTRKQLLDKNIVNQGNYLNIIHLVGDMINQRVDRRLFIVAGITGSISSILTVVLMKLLKFL